ncbi:MAG TPA: CHRD domain-containing protein [Aliidongia sp.]|uniref:CHRD domain-containing protein n=1 Tax=Aliidongia sp. TaxID=1914230 RepID=UPI002DDCAA99|nr:CHRD domain-containing protein [Aliidongia sp.]HEV2678838.1 CHRD domain-containing protein [Aliidongia sp.]
MKIRLQAGMAVMALAIAAFAAAPSAEAKTMTYRVVLNGKSETPSNTTKGTGHGTVKYDDATKELSWNIKYSGLTGDATAAHFHGPAKPGVAAGVLVPIGPKGSTVMSPIVGSATLTDDQATALTGGMMYFNVHTKENPAGEIRGQVIKAGGMKMKMPAKPKTDAAPKQ